MKKLFILVLTAVLFLAGCTPGSSPIKKNPLKNLGGFSFVEETYREPGAEISFPCLTGLEGGDINVINEKITQDAFTAFDLFDVTVEDALYRGTFVSCELVKGIVSVCYYGVYSAGETAEGLMCFASNYSVSSGDRVMLKDLVDVDALCEKLSAKKSIKMPDGYEASVWNASVDRIAARASTEAFKNMLNTVTLTGEVGESVPEASVLFAEGDVYLILQVDDMEDGYIYIMIPKSVVK